MNWINFSSNSSDESVKSRISVGDIVFGIDIFISGKSATRRKKHHVTSQNASAGGCIKAAVVFGGGLGGVAALGENRVVLIV